MKLILLFVLLATVLMVPLEAKIVYSDGPSFSIPFAFDPVVLDLNHDGTMDFAFMDQSSVALDYRQFFYINALNGAQTLSDEWGTAQILVEGDVIGNAEGWEPNLTVLTVWNPLISSWFGPLGEQKQRFVGIEFSDADGIHYGWIQVQMPQSTAGFAPIVLDWAYESTPGKPIAAGAKPIYFQVSCINDSVKAPLPSRIVGSGVFGLQTNAFGGILDYQVQVQWMYKPLDASITTAMNSGKTVFHQQIANLGSYVMTNQMVVVYSGGKLVPPNQFPAPIEVHVAVYQGELNLSAPETRDFLRGQCYLSLQYISKNTRGPKLTTKGQIIRDKEF